MPPIFLCRILRVIMFAALSAISNMFMIISRLLHPDERQPWFERVKVPEKEEEVLACVYVLFDLTCWGNQNHRDLAAADAADASPGIQKS